MPFFFRVISLLIIGYVILIGSTYAQDTLQFEVTGILREYDSKEGIALQNITVDSLQIGTASNLDGDFSFFLPKGTHKISVKVIGFLDFDTLINVNQDINNLVIELRLSKLLQLDDVVITPGENPAHRIIRNCRKNRRKNRIDKLDSYEFEEYNKTTVTLNNISKEKLEKNILLNPAKKFVNEHANDSAVVDSNSKYKVGIFINERIAKVYYNKPKKKEVIIASQTTGINNTESNIITTLLQNVNMYDNYVEILERQFLSPIGVGSMMNYRYYLVDTVYSGNDTIFGIDLVPKRSFDKVFKGRIYIETSSWALKKVDLRMNSDPNINFVEDIRIRQEFQLVDEHWMPKIKDVEVDFKNNEEKIGFIGRTSSFYKDFIIGDPKESQFYTGELVKVEKDAFEKDSTFWNKNRQSALERSDKLAYEFIEDLKTRNIWQLIIFLNEFFTTGTKRVGKFEIGPYSKLFGFNAIEGFRLQAGIYTNHKFHPRWYLGGHLAYGFGDNKLKYDAEIGYKLSLLPKVRISISRAFEVEQMGFYNYTVDGRGLWNSLLMRVPLRKLNYYTENLLQLQVDIARGIYGMFFFRTYEFDPAFDYYYIHNDELKSTFQTTELGASFRISFREKYVIRRGERIYTGSKFPILYVDYNYGFKDVLSGDFDFHKLKISISDKFKAGRFGYTNYSAQVGQIFGTLPYAALHVFKGNQSYAFDPNGFYLDALKSFVGTRNRTSTFSGGGFNLMYFYEFVADRYFEAGLDHHFEGWVLNKLPYIRWVFHKLKWKEVVSYRFAIGTISDENRAMNSPQTDPRFQNNTEIQKNIDNLIEVRTPSPVPYSEVSVGLENIFKIFRVDAVWRLNYKDPSPPSSLKGYNYNFGIRVYAGISF